VVRIRLTLGLALADQKKNDFGVSATVGWSF